MNANAGMMGEILEPEGKGGLATYHATKAQVDVQISTAKAFPRTMSKVTKNLSDWVLSDDATAESCIYSLKRGGKTIQGPSIRFAEILAHAWGNLRIDARVVDEGKDFIVVRGEAHDLQSNNVWGQDVVRRLTNSSGQRYDADLIGVTTMAAASIAQRDSVLKCIPAFIWRPAYDAALQKATGGGDAKTLADKRMKAVAQFALLGVTPTMIFKKLGIPDVNAITREHMVELFGIFNAIRDGQSNVEAEFGETVITTRSATANALAAEEDESSPAGDEAEAGKAPDAKPSAPAAPQAAAKPAAASAGGEDRKPEPQPAAKPAADPKPARAKRTGPRQDKDNDTPPPAQRASAEEKKPEAAAPANAEMSVDAMLTFFQNDCAAAKNITELRGVWVLWGPRFEGRLNEDENARATKIAEDAAAALERKATASKRDAAADDYEAAKNGEPVGGEDTAPDDAGAVYDEPSGQEPVGEGTDDAPAGAAGDPDWALFADVRPEGAEAIALWESYVRKMWAAPTQEGVMAAYEELDKSGALDKLPEQAALNMRTVRFKIKRLRPGA